jgi:WhiB family redox-sensing transcriptional regulator
MRPPPWTDDAICAQTDPEVFYPEKGVNPEKAKRICRSCPVVAECLEFALTTYQGFGVWGGKSPIERREIRMHRRAA